MRIEELIIEGFKSYPVRTQITGWDPSFNAITGLNGSGKSNILDAIAFVLGLTSMSTMRAQNQTDLIYKRGQAGVTKASVTIVFDNSDKEKSPIGFQDCNQITVTRQYALPNISKYLINGHKSQQQAVQNLFQSVQLNINNPNFVIMQGRITKVLNMRPQEILGMVEEAAGTRMFEDRKDKAKKTMTKKDKRLQELTSTLNEEITPKLNKLREEKRSFLEYQKAETEFQRLERVLQAWEWTELRRRSQEAAESIQEKKELKKELEAEKKTLGKEMSTAENEVKRACKKRDEEMKKGGKISQLEEEVAGLDKEVVKLRTQVEIKEGTIHDEEEQVKNTEQEVQELEASLAKKQVHVDNAIAEFESVKAANKAATDKLRADEELLQTLLTGLSSKNNASGAGGGGYMGQIADAKALQANASSDEEQCRVERGMSEKELKELEARFKKLEKEADQGQKRVDEMKTVVAEYSKRLEACGWNEDKEREGEARITALKNEERELSDRREHVRRNLGSLEFDYVDPHPGWDRSKVRGRIGRLVQLAEEDYNKATALEVTAGGRLYQIVVDNEQVSTTLLGTRLKRRETFVPLTKMNAFVASNAKKDAADKIAPGKVRLALDVVSYDQKMAPAMAYAFGGTFVCDDSDTAKKVTFSRDVSIRSVTLAGDTYDPSGTLSGGSAPSSSGILVRVQALLDVETELARVQGQLYEAEKNWNGDDMKKRRDTWKRLARDMEIKSHELRLAEEQVGESNATRVGGQVEQLKAKIQRLITGEQEAKQKQKAAADEIKKLQKDMEEFKNNKDGKIDELKASISKQKTALQKRSVELKTKQKDHQSVLLEHEQMKTDLVEAKERVEEAKGNVAKLRKDLVRLKDQLAVSKASFEKAEAKLKEERATLTRFDKEIKDLEQAIKDKKKALTDIDNDIENAVNEVTNLEKEKVACKNGTERLEQLYEWIPEEQHLFGQEGHQYHFEAMDIAEMRRNAEDLEKSQRAKKKKVNPKVMNMLDDVEKRENDLKRNLSTVMKDKEKIEETIEELDRYKRDALMKTWQKVDGDFGSIFAELLPGNFAKLQPPEDQDLMDGLEVKVRLGSVWKQSLTELSGGQRSLIALSLIMALLQFKPAPMYILDEIDAALDLSHTQHIGHLFRTRFKGSQFIVVSLKEGLFTNANVLFRTRFRDGTSIVERTANRSTSSLYDSSSNDRQDGNQGGRRSRR
ncbi:condensin complex subunit SMC2 [Dendrothele bispora CBS 962.96]|uniref:Structural maintenance of chromosomes protein n=1 Tax=Dendrothele bispora (strain CBS 962.96) TaxID=1314807 RepID=A0A4S8LR96_DENBC|nr:condensin complex subunit SMC2 [Dendrothele bispora CBS 962.96]